MTNVELAGCKFEVAQASANCLCKVVSIIHAKLRKMKTFFKSPSHVEKIISSGPAFHDQGKIFLLSH